MRQDSARPAPGATRYCGRASISLTPSPRRAATIDRSGSAAGTTRSTTKTSSRLGATRFNCSVAIRSNPLRRTQRLDLELQMAVDLQLLRPLVLHLLDPVAVLEQLEVLPCGEQQDRDEKHADGPGSPQLTLTGLIDLADDRVVAHVVLDEVLEVLFAHANLSAARSLALRARGFRVTSSGPGRRGRLVSTWSAISPPRSSSRSTVLTIRSSRE